MFVHEEQGQIITANLLAVTLRHWWAFQPGDEPETWDAVKAALDDREAEEREAGAFWGGVTARPDEEDDYVRHTTGTGRLSWAVAPGGEAVIELHRPALGVVAEVQLHRAPGLGWRVAVDVRQPEEFYLRHLWALDDALRGLADPRRLGLDGYGWALAQLAPHVPDGELLDVHAWLAEPATAPPWSPTEAAKRAVLCAARGRGRW